MPTPGVGLGAAVTAVVSEADTAASLGSGDVPVLGTPRVVGLCEEATVAAVAPALGPGETTVGTRVELDHLAPTVTGASVTARARVTAVEGRSLGFDVTVLMGDVVVARGRITRVRVDRERFLSGVAEASSGAR